MGSRGVANYMAERAEMTCISHIHHNVSNTFTNASDVSKPKRLQRMQTRTKVGTTTEVEALIKNTVHCMSYYTTLVIQVEAVYQRLMNASPDTGPCIL
jgi:hypothetical protein